jgi:hypothetical protein
VPYGELDALRFKLATIDGTTLESLPNPIWLSILITIALHFAARDVELNQLKMLVEKLADKVNACGDTPAERLAAVENRLDEVATHGIRLGTTLGLAAMATHTGVDYSTWPRGF